MFWQRLWCCDSKFLTCFLLTSHQQLHRQVQVFNNGDWSNGNSLTITVRECDTSNDLGTMTFPLNFCQIFDRLYISGEVICPKLGLEGFCTLFSAWGTRVTNCVDLKSYDNVFMVPEGRLFMIPTRGIGTTIITRSTISS